MTITPSSLIAYINSIKGTDTTITNANSNKIVNYILKGGLNAAINVQKSNDGGTF